jgi:type VI secretion system protein ImpF
MTNRHALSLWERLVSDEQEEGLPVMTQANKAQILRSVLKDLIALLNEVAATELFDCSKPPVAASVLAFGLPPITGRTLSKAYMNEIAQRIHTSILRFEPRLSPSSLTVYPVEYGQPQQNHLMAYEIKGTILCEPYSIEMELQAQMDFDSGRFVDNTRFSQ